jgi:glycosyltransferase involved in cell wall biosynthesis
MLRVVVVHSSIKHYREPFFDALHESLCRHGIELRIVFGQPTAREGTKGDTFAFERPWAIPVKNSWFFNERLLYQPVLREAKSADLVIVEQANKHLANYLLLLLRRRTGAKIAFWGHGRNRQVSSKSLPERFKNLLLRAPDWWFAYTQGVADFLIRRGMEAERITTVQNSIDTAAFRKELMSVSDEVLAGLRERHGLRSSALVGLYCGSLYPDKQIGFLLEAARRVRIGAANFHLVVIGGGPQASLVEAAAAQEGWIHFVGPRFGAEKAAWFCLADFFLNPGMVGLSILDSFCAGLPMLTTDYPGHSPEIDYLEPGGNGLCSIFEPQAYAAAVTRLINDPILLARLRKGALESSGKYTMAAMVANVSEGIRRCLGLLEEQGQGMESGR